jgi:hypothetical protein
MMIELLSGVIEIVLWVVLGVIAAQHVLGPILVWRSERVPASYNFPPMEVSTFLRQQTPEVQAALAQLEALGFAPAAASVLEKSNVKAGFLLLQHGTELASAMLVVASHAKGSIHYAEFTQIFTDGTMLDVFSCPTASIYPTDTKTLKYRFPGMAISELYGTFVKINTRLQQHKTPTRTLEIGDELTDLAQKMNLDVAGLVKRGYYTPSADRSQYRLTLKGACLFTWRLVWPWKPLFNYFELARARRALAEM